jgi:hypothetical protein
MTHPTTAPHAKSSRESSMGGRGSQCATPSITSASHDDNGTSWMPVPPRTAKRPSLITHPQQLERTLIPGSSLQLHVASTAPCSGGPHTSAESQPPMPPAQTTCPSRENYCRQRSSGSSTPQCLSTSVNRISPPPGYYGVSTRVAATRGPSPLHVAPLRRGDGRNTKYVIKRAPK